MFIDYDRASRRRRHPAPPRPALSRIALVIILSHFLICLAVCDLIYRIVLPLMVHFHHKIWLVQPLYDGRVTFGIDFFLREVLAGLGGLTPSTPCPNSSDNTLYNPNAHPTYNIGQNVSKVAMLLLIAGWMPPIYHGPATSILCVCGPPRWPRWAASCYHCGICRGRRASHY